MVVSLSAVCCGFASINCRGSNVAAAAAFVEVDGAGLPLGLDTWVLFTPNGAVVCKERKPQVHIIFHIFLCGHD